MEDAKSHLEVNAVEKVKASLSEGTSLLSERQKLILLADKSEFGWKTVEEYTQHELADSEADSNSKKLSTAEERAEKALKSAASKKSAKHSTSILRTLTLQYGLQNSCDQNERLPFTHSSCFLSRNDNCFACGKFGHWRSECPQTQWSGSKGNL